MDILAGSSAGNVGNSAGAQLNDGDYDSCLKVERVSLFKSQDKGHPCLKIEVSLTEDANGHEEGFRAEVFEKLAGNEYASYDTEARGRAKRFLGALVGLEKPADIDAQISGKDLDTAASDAQPAVGEIVSATVTSKKSKDGTKRYPKAVFRPASNKKAVTQVKAVVPPPPAPVAASTSTKFSEANGFYPHPGMEPGHVYNAAGEVYHVATGTKVA